MYSRGADQGNNEMHEIDIKRGLFAIASVLAVSYACVKAVFSGSMMLKAAIITAPLILFFINQPAALLMAMFLVDTAGLNIPGLWASVTLANLLQLLIIALGIARRIITKAPVSHRELSDRMLLLFALNLIVVIYFRGLGLQIVGSSMLGGMGYVILFLAIGVNYFACDLHLTPKQIKFFIIANIVAGMLPAFVQIAFILSGGKFYILAYFIQANLNYVARSVFSTVQDSVSRLSSLREIALPLVTIALVFHFKRLDGAIRLMLICAAFVAVMLSGFRSSLLTLLVIVGSWLFFRANGRNRLVICILGFLGGVLAWVFLFFFVDILPPSVARSLSWIPGLNISAYILNDAQGSLEWRWEIWRYMLEEVPNYLFIGKGFCFPAEFLVTANPWAGVEPHAHFLVHNYHSGPLSMALDLGLPGFITGTFWMILSSREHIKGGKYFSTDNTMSRYYQLLTITYVWNCVSFYLIFGDARSSICMLLLSGTLLRVLRYSVRDKREEACE